MKRLVIAIAFMLAGCGGGGSSAPSAPPAPPPVPNTTWAYGYFGITDLGVTAPHTTILHAVDWGNWDSDRELIEQRIIAQLQEARSRGVTQAILSTGFLTFNSQFAYLGPAGLIAFKARLDALDLGRMIVALYPIDEPDVHRIPDSVMTQAVNDARAAWPGVKIAVVYGTNGTPGITAFDWIGYDNYQAGAGVLQRLLPLRDDQSWIIIAGGADPYRQDPSPFRDFAFADHRVALVWAFLYEDYVDPDGVPRKGIAKNGLLPAYTAVGVAIKG